MPLRRVPIRRIGNRHSLFMGGDRELMMMAALAAFALVFTAQTLYATVFGLTLWFVALFVLRAMAKSDPRMRSVLWRHVRRYNKYYPARATPFRENTNSQEWHYR